MSALRRARRPDPGRAPVYAPRRIARPQPRRAKRPERPEAAPRCACGEPALYHLPLILLRPDLESEVRISLLLCEACYALECMMQEDLGRRPLKASRLR